MDHIALPAEFVSANGIPVERATFTQARFVEIVRGIKRAAIKEYEKQKAEPSDEEILAVWEQHGDLHGRQHRRARLRALLARYGQPAAPVAAQARPATPRYDAWDHLRKHGTWPDGIPDWARDHDGRMSDTIAARAVIAELAAAAAQAPAIPAGCILVQEADVVPHVHPEYGPGVFFTEDAKLDAAQAPAATEQCGLCGRDQVIDAAMKRTSGGDHD